MKINFDTNFDNITPITFAEWSIKVDELNSTYFANCKVISDNHYKVLGDTRTKVAERKAEIRAQGLPLNEEYVQVTALEGQHRVWQAKEELRYEMQKVQLEAEWKAEAYILETGLLKSKMNRNVADAEERVRREEERAQKNNEREQERSQRSSNNRSNYRSNTNQGSTPPPQTPPQAKVFITYANATETNTNGWKPITITSKTDAAAILGINYSSTPEEAKKAYRAIALVWHPDMNADKVAEAVWRFTCITQAYELFKK